MSMRLSLWDILWQLLPLILVANVTLKKVEEKKLTGKQRMKERKRKGETERKGQTNKQTKRNKENDRELRTAPILHVHKSNQQHVRCDSVSAAGAGGGG